MEKFARIVVGYHGCERRLADGLLTGKVPIAEWNKSDNAYDWLGEGIYFWEHSPTRAWRWATERFRKRAAVIGVIIQLGTCFSRDNPSFLEPRYRPRPTSRSRSGMPIASWASFGQTYREGFTMRQPTIEEMRAALAATELPPKEHFARMVADGLINSEGKLTKLYGGEAEPEPWAKRPPALTSANVNGERDQPPPNKKRRSRRT